MINDSIWPKVPFYTFKSIDKNTNENQIHDLLLIDSIKTSLNIDYYAKSQLTSQLMTWLVLYDLNTNNFIILESFEWGCSNLIDSNTLLYKIDGPRTSTKQNRIPNCLFFPQIANDSLTIIKKSPQNKQIQFSPVNKLLQNFNSPPFDRNQSNDYKKLGYKIQPLL